MKKWGTFAILCLIWGSSFILMKKGLVVFSHDQVAALRIFVTFLCFLPFVIKLFSQKERKVLKILFFATAFGNGIPAFLFAFAQTEVSSSMSGMLNSLSPLFTLIFGFMLFKVKSTPAQVIGVLIGFLGAGLLILYGKPGKELSINAYGALIVIATMCYALNVNLIKKYLKEIRPLMIIGVGSMFIGPPCGIYLFSTDFITRFEVPGALTAFTSVVLLAVFGTAIALVLFNYLLKLSSALFASSIAYVLPVVAIVLGLFDGEIITWIHIVGILVILTGVYLVNRRA